ncbi:MAG TPA: MFS transporter [Vicinamibacterales bacterium]
MNSRPSLWSPLRNPIFRNLLIADVVSDMGTFMQSVGAAWLMVSLGGGPTLVALTQTASTLPFFLLALPAGAIGDIVDRRKLILLTEAWMVAIAVVLTITTIAGVMSPWLLLTLTFALSAGDAIETPTWRAVLPELVSKADLSSASALNGIEFNFARAVGPALAGALIAAAGVGAAFAANVVSFVGVIIVVARWKRPPDTHRAPPETLSGATVAALRYVRNSPSLGPVMLRVGVTMCTASALLALLPSVAHGLSDSPTVYGVLLGCFGTGAIVGALMIQPACGRWSLETVVSGSVVVLGIMIMAAAAAHSMIILGLVLLVAGGAWIAFISLVSALVQTLAPNWARARILAVFLLIFQGGLAIGSAFWGALAARVGIDTAFVIAGFSTVATAALGFVARFPNVPVDLSGWNHWRMPAIRRDAAPSLEEGPVLVTVEYHVPSDHAERFLRAMEQYGRVRRRDGAFRWEVFRDLERADIFLEIFEVASWAEHLRQHDRFTRADAALEEEILHYAQTGPTIRHLISAKSV